MAKKKTVITAAPITKDHKENFRNLKKQADQGDPVAQNQVGVLFERGLGAKKSYAKALQYYRASAHQGFVGGQYNLAWAYGWRKKDHPKSVIWFSKAAKQGDGESMRELSYKYAYGKGVKIDPVKAFMWFLLFRCNVKEIKSFYQKTKYPDEHVLASVVTERQIQRAQKLAENWQQRFLEKI